MSKTKDHFYDKEIEKLENGTVSDQTSVLNVFTCTEAKSLIERTNWHYKIYGNNNTWGDFPIKEDSGHVQLCECGECKEFGVDLYEYYSMVQALEWISSLNADIPVVLFATTTKSLMKEDDNAGLGYPSGPGYTCEFIQEMNSRIFSFYVDLDIERIVYCYKNKESLPVIFS